MRVTTGQIAFMQALFDYERDFVKKVFFLCDWSVGFETSITIRVTLILYPEGVDVP